MVFRMVATLSVMHMICSQPRLVLNESRITENFEFSIDVKEPRTRACACLIIGEVVMFLGIGVGFERGHERKSAVSFQVWGDTHGWEDACTR